MKLDSLLDKDELSRLLTEGLVGVQHHPTLPLRIFNYTQRAQYAGQWGGAIDYCRGLIVDDKDNVIERPFKKFFNLNTSSIPETMEANLPQSKPIITTKMDGSLGIYWYYDGHEGIATRGSFTSPQALWATDWYMKHRKIQHGDGYGGTVEWPIETTTLFEIIYPENRIVVKYDFEGLVVLGMVDIEKGFEWAYEDFSFHAQFNQFRVTKKIDGVSLMKLKEANIENEEGYVLTYLKRDAPPLKVKVKMADYLRLHKIVTGMNARSVWELLSSDTNMSQFEHTPEHFKKWYFFWRDKLLQEYDDVLFDAVRFWRNRPKRSAEDTDRSYRAVFAQYVRTFAPEPLRGVLFAMLDNKNIDPIVWKIVKPRGDDATFRTEGE